MNVRAFPSRRQPSGHELLLDLVVFGKHAGLRAAEYARGSDYSNLPGGTEAESRSQFDALKNGSGKENAFTLSTEMKKVMFEDVGIYRSGSIMGSALDKVLELRKDLQAGPCERYGENLQHGAAQRLGAGQHARRGGAGHGLNRTDPAAGIRARTIPTAMTRTG